MNRLRVTLPVFGAIVWAAPTVSCLDTQRGRVATDAVAIEDSHSVPDTDTGSVDTTQPVDTTPEDTVELGFFGGGWLIEQPNHALYEASLYRFRADARIELVESTPPNCTGHLDRFCETGHVSPPDGTVLCRFGGGLWGESGPRELTIDAVCDDGVQRKVVLDFTQVDPAMGGTPTIVDVDGDTSWRHSSWDWTFRRCDSAPSFGTEPIVCD